MLRENTLTGIGLLSLEIIHFISSGKKEEISDIESHMRDGDLIEYLTSKYKDSFYVSFDNSVYDNACLNKYFSNYTGYIEGNERRKYGIMNDDDGLLLILALISDIVEQKCREWTVDS